jgi:hypothetical protein
MTEKELKAKTKSIAISVAVLCQKLPGNKVNNTYIDQILRSSASMGANYRRPAEVNQSKTLSINCRLWKKKQMKQCSFLNYWQNLMKSIARK